MSQLIRFVYASRSVHTPANGAVDPVVGSILAQSRRNNPREQISGVLFFGDGYFFQCLEGEESKVIATFNRILKDDRHQDARVLMQEEISERLFTDWSMKYVPAAEGVQSLLKENGYRRFTPFEFSPHFINTLIRYFQQLQQTPSSGADEPLLPGQAKQPAAQNGILHRIAARLGFS
ncbi:MAG: blue light sensor protein [Oceanospirillaceae bacterium]|nr:blue light sensor protein [Oceanospirillaceae bacterium]MBT13794.1 blue light sensor protein [Oceanospirillaceae bacterium]|tara:strand:+ start:21690 stop:22220 length:531 start_codon:yes stop_codon:yes gene_type:complete